MICALIAAPTVFSFLPWGLLAIQGIIRAHRETQLPTADSYYVHDKHLEMLCHLFEFLLWICALVAEWGFIAIAANVLRYRWKLVVWGCALFAGFGMALYNYPNIPPPELAATFNSSGLWLVILNPAIVGVCSLLALFFTIRTKVPQPA
jgi:hypothetical protein